MRNYVTSNDATYLQAQVLKARENNDYHFIKPYYTLRNYNASVA